MYSLAAALSAAATSVQVGDSVTEVWSTSTDSPLLKKASLHVTAAGGGVLPSSLDPVQAL